MDILINALFNKLNCNKKISVCNFAVFVSTVVVVVTLCCHPASWATLLFWGLWLPWCITVMASSTASEMTGGQARHKNIFIKLLHSKNFLLTIFVYC